MRVINNIKIGIQTQFATATIVVLLAIIALSVLVLGMILAPQVDATVSTSQMTKAASPGSYGNGNGGGNAYEKATLQLSASFRG